MTEQAHPQDLSGPATPLKVVVFRIANSTSDKELEYAIDIGQVQEISVVEHITRVPGAPRYVKGVMNLRGKIISIIDVREKLGLAPPSNASGVDGRIVVAQLKSSSVGLLVDEVENVMQFSPAEMESSPEIIKGTAPYIRGIAKRGERLIVILDLATFLETERDGAAKTGDTASA